MRIPGIAVWRPLAIGAGLGALLASSALYVATHLPFSPFGQTTAPAATEAGSVTAAAAQPLAKKGPSAPLAVPSSAVPPPTPAPAAAAPQPGLGGPAIGQVTAIGRDPSTFTILTQSGDQLTYRVLDTTVFAAGRDRPYNFGLLKIGDEVRLRGRATPPAAMAQQSG